MSTKKYKDIFKADGSGRLQDVYADFISAEELAISQFEKQSSEAFTSSKYKTLLDLLFPKSQSGCYIGSKLWKKIKELAGDEDELSKFVAKKIRLYHYDGSSNSASSVESEISEFYKKYRPSAYNAIGADKDKSLEYSHLAGGLRDLLNASTADSTIVSELKSSLTMILVDTPSIDLKLRHADIVSTFINYTPGIMAAQMIPYLDVKFSLRRNGVEGNQKTRPQTVMTPLKFLLGSQPTQDGSADALIYDAYTASVVREKIEIDNINDDAIKKYEAEAARAKQQGKTLAPFDARNLQPRVVKDGVTVETTTTGMEMFLMPQTLINMDYDQENVPRYNEVLNPTLPFGTILTFNINVTSAGYGVFSYKTGVLTLKIFDRSRLVEIADFLNPKLYGQATLWITYGWRAPAQPLESLERNEYLAMINENMLKKEAYGIQNSSISIADDGTATVTLNLFMKFANELSQVTPVEGSAYFDAAQQRLEAQMTKLRELGERLGLPSSGAKNMRGGIILQSALGGTLPTLDAKAIADEMSAIQGAFNNSTNPDAKEFIALARSVYSIAAGASKSEALGNIESVAQAIVINRFDKLKATSNKDVWSVISNDTKNSKFENDKPPPPNHPLAEMHKLLAERKITSANRQAIDQSVFGRFGDVSFARLFAVFFASAARTLTDYNANPEIDEYQIIFYNFNEFAGTVASVNIGEFPIDMDLLIKAYTEHVTKQKGEKMNILNFLEIVRSSQFGNEKHKAFGFSDLYDEKGEFKKNHTDELLKRQMENRNLGSAFVPPAVDFYVETSNADGETAILDLLTIFEVGSTFSTSGKKPDGFKKILRIHVYDKASIPHKAAYDILRDDSGAFVEVESAWKNAYLKSQKEILTSLNSKTKNNTNAKKNGEAYNQKQSGLTLEKSDTQINVSFDNDGKTTKIPAKTRSVSFKDSSGKARFNLAKREISRFVPTLTIGTNGTLIKSINYGSEQDAMLSTIMMLRNTSPTENPSQPNGSSTGDLPLRVIPGKLSMTTMGCPLLEYMQQFFVDLGTGTTIDNLYNITGLTHNLSPGGFTSEIQFTFADAYGKYESPQTYTQQMNAIAETLRRKAAESTGIQEKPQFPAKSAKK